MEGEKNLQVMFSPHLDIIPHLRITPLKPPGGESKLNLKEDLDDEEVVEEELEERCVR